MQTSIAVVRSVTEGQADVELASAGCGRCDEPGGCGGQSLSRAFCGAPKRFRIANSLDARPGDRVRIGIDPAQVRVAATAAYLIPLLALLSGALLGASFGSLPSVVLGLLGLGGAWFWLTTSKKNELAPPVMIERVLQSPVEEASTRTRDA